MKKVLDWIINHMVLIVGILVFGIVIGVRHLFVIGVRHLPGAVELAGAEDPQEAEEASGLGVAAP